MARVQRKNKDSETSWLQTFYNICHSDTRWAKEQGWRVVNWTLALFSALLAIQGLLFQNMPWFVFAAIGLGILAVSFFYLTDLHRWAATTRGNADRIEKRIGSVSEILERASNRNHCTYLVVQVVVVLVAFALFAIATYYCCSKCTAA